MAALPRRFGEEQEHELDMKLVRLVKEWQKVDAGSFSRIPCTHRCGDVVAACTHVR